MEWEYLCSTVLFIAISFPLNSHDFIGEFTTSYRELARGQSQFNVYEVSDFFSCPQNIRAEAFLALTPESFLRKGASSRHSEPIGAQPILLFSYVSLIEINGSCAKAAPIHFTWAFSVELPKGLCPLTLLALQAQ